MPNIKFISILIIVLGVYNSFSQELIVTYKIDSKASISEFKKNLENEKNPMAIKMGEVHIKSLIEAQKSTYSLEIDKNVSYFHLNEILLSDSNSEVLNNLIKIIAEKGNFYQNAKKKQILEKNDTQTIAYGFDFYNWKLINETKEILGYTCYKAEASYTEPHPIENRNFIREITVWYAPELSFNFGPQGYGGLPGLILEKCQSGNCFTATKITNTNVTIDWPKEKTVTREEYFKTIRKQSINFKF